MQNDTLFVYFCGTEEETGKHVSRFMPAVEAKYHLYINGVASGRTDFQRLDNPFREDLKEFKKISGWCVKFPEDKSAFLNRIHDLKVTTIPGASNSQHCSFTYTVDEGKKQVSRQIYTIEKQYDGYRLASAFGYSENDIKKVVTYTLDRLLTILQLHKEIKHVVFSGHSRGAAVALSSFLYYLLESLDKPRPGDLPTARKALKALDKLDVLFLDPVAGQQGSANYYRMVHKKDWTTADLYHALDEELPNLNSITEVYANAAKMASKLVVGLRSFNPSKSFLEDFYLDKNNLFKFFLGFSHSAMVDPFDSKGLPQVYDRVKHYETIEAYKGDFLLKLVERLEKGKKPFDLIVDFINSYAEFTKGKGPNQSRFQKYYESFADSDGIFSKLIAKYNDPEIAKNKHKIDGKERTEYQILNDVFPKKEVVDQVLGFVKLRRDAFFVNRRGEKTSLAELVENNALSFGVTPDGLFELQEVVQQYVEEHDDVGDAIRRLFEDVEEEEKKEIKHIEAERKKTKREEEKKKKTVVEDDDDPKQPNDGKNSKVNRKDDDVEDDDDDDSDDKKEDKRSDREKKEDERASRAKKRREAIKDLLAATGGNIPDFYNEVSKELRKQMSVENHIAFDPPGYLQFEEGVFRTPDLASADLSKAMDFYALSQLEQKLLYDRVGLFKGIVIDHSKDIPVQQGFRDVLKREKTTPVPGQAADAQAADAQTSVVRVLFKRPRLSGYYESTYTFDESERKTQEVGVFSLGFGLAVNYSSFKLGVGVRAGFNYGNQHMHQGSSHKKRVEITSSFFLPKIDLSFDALRPCAADEFVEAVTQALLQLEGGEAPFLRLCKVLKHYGHFVPLNLLIGGRLYSVNKKEITETQEISDSLTEYNAKLQVAVETMVMDAGIESTMNKTDSEKVAEKKKKEEQSLRVTAVGGEGAYVHNVNKWVESLAHYTQWGLVKFDNLIPSLQLLPLALQAKCKRAILDFVQHSTIDDLLAIGAHFLFYNGYMEDFGSKVPPKFFCIQNIHSGKLLSVENGSMSNGNPVVLAQANGSESQLWWLNASGKLLCKKGYFGEEVYALTAQAGKLVITQDNYFSGQYWELGGGMIRNSEGNPAVGLQIVDSSKPNERVALTSVDATTQGFTSWRIVGTPQVERLKPSKRDKKAEQLENNAAVMEAHQYLNNKRCMSSPNGDVVLTLDEQGLEIRHRRISNPLWKITQAGSKELAIRQDKLVIVYRAEANEQDQERVIFENPQSALDSLELLDNGNLELLDIDKEQVWQSDSIIYSMIKCEANQGVLSIYHSNYAPSLDSDKRQVMLMPYVGADHQLWYINRNGQIVSKLKRHGTANFALTCNDHGELSLQALSAIDPGQRWQMGDEGHGAIVNKHNNFRLTHELLGKPLKALANASADWRVISETAKHGKSRKMIMKTQDMGKTVKFDYVDYHAIAVDQNRSKGQWHNRTFKMPYNLETIALYEQYGAVALRGGYRMDNGTDSKQNNDVSSEARTEKEFRDFHVDSSPIYLPQRNDLTLGLCAKDNRMALFVENKDGHRYHNEDWNNDNHFTIGEQCGIINMGGAYPTAEEVLVGIGLTKVGSSFTTYILVIPK